MIVITFRIDEPTMQADEKQAIVKPAARAWW